MTGPKEGIYLDAALAVIGEHLEERIDELSRRRRARRRLGVAALSVFALASGSVAAVALTAPHETAPPAVVALSTAHTVQCVEGDAADRDAYFTVRYRVGGGVEVDAAALCSRAWTALAVDSAEVLGATPEELTAVAAGYVADATGDAASAVDVSDAAFGRQSATGAPPAMIACGRGASTLVLAPLVLPSTAADRLRLCAQAGS